MKTFIIINGKYCTIIERKDMESAIEYATNYMDHSKEVIVREVEDIVHHDQNLLEIMKRN